MEQGSPSRSPKTRWYRRRKLLFVLVLLAGCAVAVLTWDTLFMPEDLRRMQGSWKIVKWSVGKEEKEQQAPVEVMVFRGRNLILEDEMPIEVRDGTFFLYDYGDNEAAILGFTVRLPFWLRRAQAAAYGTYEFKDRQLILWLKGEIDLAKNVKDEREDSQHKFYLERE